MSKKQLTFKDSRTAFAFLQAHYGIPKGMLEQIRLSLAEGALADGEDMGFNRYYTAVVLALRRATGFGPVRIGRVLTELDSICGDIINGKYTWEDTMRMVDAETGFIIRRGKDGDWVCEYKTQEEKETGRLMQ